MANLIVCDYRCPTCGDFEAMIERPAPDELECQCGEIAYWTPSPVLGRVKLASATQGKVSKAEKASWTNTEALGEGQPFSEWRKERDKVWRDKRYRQNKRDDRKGMA